MTSTSAVMLCCAAEVEHLLRLGDAADGRAGEAAASEDEAEDRDGQRFLGRADHGDVAVAGEQVDVGVDVVSAATQSRMKSKLPACFFISSALRETTTSSAPRRSASSFLLGEVVKTTVCAPNAWANFTPMWPSPPRPTTPTFLPLRDAPVTHRRVGRDARRRAAARPRRGRGWTGCAGRSARPRRCCRSSRRR